MCWTCKNLQKQNSEYGLCVRCRAGIHQQKVEKNLNAAPENLDDCYEPNDIMASINKLEKSIDNFLNVLKNGLD
jgi:hypothetical protein